MSLENPDKILRYNKPTTPYPERASSGFDETLEKLRALEEGKSEKLNLSEHQKEELLDFENELGEEMDRIFDIKVNTRTFFTDYLLTDEGRKRFEEITNVSLSDATMENIARIILQNRIEISKADVSKLSALEGDSEKYTEKTLLETLSERVDENGQLNIDGLSAPERVSLITNPQNALDKISSLRKYKSYLKKLDGKIDDADSKGAPDFTKAKKKIIEGFRLRVNEMIANQYSPGIKIKRVIQTLGFESVTEDERKLFENFDGFTKPDKNLERLDKFIYGESRELDTGGKKRRISEEILDFADKVESDFAENEIRKNDLLRKRGFDPEKVFAKNIPPEVFTKIAESVVAHYGELSSCPPSDYSTDRPGPASDGKWQVAAHPRFNVMSVNFKQHVIKSSIAPKSIFDIITTLCGHEIEGHFIQNLNKKLASTRLLRKAGSDRKEIYSEAAAMMVEDQVASQAFGLRSFPHAHYVRAMQRKLGGGDYLDSVKAFFESGSKISKRKRREELIDNKQYKEEIRDMLKLAVNRSKRLFRGTDSLSQSSSYLRNSKDTVYLEQLILADKLKAKNMEKYLFFSGGNISTLISYAEMGIINLQDIRQPDYFSVKVWDVVKRKYLLKD